MKTKMSKSTVYICRAAVIAALYVVLTLLSYSMGLASGVIQLRLSEALCVLPIFTSAAIPGLAVGCMISNLITASPVWDVVFGSLATLAGAVGAYMLRRVKYLSSLPTVLANIAIVPPVLIYAYGVEESWIFIAATVGLGEIICCSGLGSLLITSLSKTADKIFK